MFEKPYSNVSLRPMLLTVTFKVLLGLHDYHSLVTLESDGSF